MYVFVSAYVHRPMSLTHSLLPLARRRNTLCLSALPSLLRKKDDSEDADGGDDDDDTTAADDSMESSRPFFVVTMEFWTVMETFWTVCPRLDVKPCVCVCVWIFFVCGP